MRFTSIGSLVLAFAVTSVAQQPATTIESGKASLSGTVIKDPGGEPLKKVVVQVISEDRQDVNYTAVTGSDGRFSLDEIQSGRYHMFLEKSGFFEVTNGRRRSSGETISISGGQKVEALVLHMLAAAVITGRVVDEDGEPMANVEIAVLRNGYVNGRRQPTAERSDRTNDVGEYRIGGLSPGHYLLVATPSPEFFSSGQKESADPAKRDMGYVPTYYPGVPDSSQAAPIELRAGEETPVDFTLVPTHTFHIRGTVTNLPRDAGIAGSDTKGAVMLVSKSMGTVFSAAEVDKNGKFDIHGVASGSYQLILTTPGADAAVVSRDTVDVNSADVNELRVGAMVPGNIQGKLRLEQGARGDPSRFTVFLQSADDGTDGLITYEAGTPGFARVKQDGSFELKNVAAGSYRIEVQAGTSESRDYYLQNVVVNGREASDGSVRLGGGLTFNMELVLSGGTGVVQGTALDNKNEPVKQATVVALPDGRNRARHDIYRTADTDQYGRFTLRGLRPGQYTVIAWDYVEDGAYFDPQFVKSYESVGKVVQVSAGQSQELSVQVQPGSSE